MKNPKNVLNNKKPLKKDSSIYYQCSNIRPYLQVELQLIISKGIILNVLFNNILRNYPNFYNQDSAYHKSGYKQDTKKNYN